MTPADMQRIRALGPEKCPPDVQEDYRLASDYDAGLLNDHGGGNVDWWQDYLRAEIGRSNDHWRDQYDALAAEALDLRAALAEAEKALAKVSGAINDAFAAGTEEREGGSWRRQGALGERYEAVRAEAQAALASIREVLK